MVLRRSKNRHICHDLEVLCLARVTAARCQMADRDLIYLFGLKSLQVQNLYYLYNI